MENIYQNGKIYAVKNDITDEVYIGSTVVSLSRRMVQHRSDAKMYPDKMPLTRKMNEIGIEHFYIELVEDYPCKNTEHLNKREGELIRELATINKRVEQRTPTEIAEQRREYRETHHDHFLQCRREWTEKNREKLREQNRAQKAKDKDKIYEREKAWKSTKIECPCGGKYTNCHKAEHLKSTRHQEYINKNN